MTKEFHRDVVIVGGGVGGCAAALALAEQGKSIALTEEYRWIGGQFTSQAVPPDENPYIDRDNHGSTRRYRTFRNNIRKYYQENYSLTPEALSNKALNIGNGWVGPLCHEPKVSYRVLKNMLAPYESNGQITIFTKHKPVEAEVDRDKVTSITTQHQETNEKMIFKGSYFLDATECGDVLELANVEHVTGSESHNETGEPHALSGEGDPNDIQGITYCFAMDYHPGEDHRIDKPPMYNFWRNYKANFWPDRQLSWTSPVPWTLQPETKTLFPVPGETDPTRSLWLFRQIVDKEHFVPDFYKSSITLVNWPQNDYWLGNIYNVSEEEKKKHLYQAKQQSLSLLYWMQTDAPRPDGGTGYPGLRLRGDIAGDTKDGLAMAPYVRESRRIKAEFTVREQDIGVDARGTAGPEMFDDSIGIGSYRIDLHPSTGGRNYIDISTYDFQIPLGSLIPQRMENVLPAAKNIGTTHITNGCYRLHPVEWNIGEVSGALAAYSLDKKVTPRTVRNNEHLLKDFQHQLVRQGIELHWPNIGTR